MGQLVVSPSPHARSSVSTPNLMYGVIAALLPALAVSIFYFGIGSLIVTLTSVASCVLFEYLIQKFLLKQTPTICDGSAILTGLLLAFNLPSNLPIGIIIVGAAFAIGVGKMAFGGLGQNLFNPALAGRVFLLISFPVQMTTWPVPQGLATNYIDAETGATTLNMLKNHFGNVADASQMFLGNMGGSLGEVSALALLIGFGWLLYKRIITWHIPVTIFATVFVFQGILYLADPVQFATPVQHLLAGGLMLGAIFMATDYVTSPMSVNGKIVYAIGIGVITVVIRNFGAFPEGMSFAILIMNAFTPLINNYIKPKRFGEVK
ncbi:MAG: RnfABCDGE type electron transport complex subunit D [Salinivirgaceae bacterium]|nr:RnfABCDGE type electron transport complex subunit D [Salinivirgaceae bacterium]MBR5957677.1 RnfABCDGE type electron transport complex subunit D [Salinivirgaceae bacterium]